MQNLGRPGWAVFCVGEIRNVCAFEERRRKSSVVSATLFGGALSGYICVPTCVCSNTYQSPCFLTDIRVEVPP